MQIKRAPRFNGRLRGMISLNHMNQESKKCKQEFILDSNELGFYEKMKVPAPKVCPDCRFKMRAMFRNEMALYSGCKCDLCGKSIVSMYNPKAPYIIYCPDCFYSEKWEPRDYAKNYDFSRPFLEQMKEFLISVPKISLFINFSDGKNVNSDYANMAGGLKNFYLVFNTSPAEDLMYSRGARYGNDSSDIYFGTSFERCYGCVNVQQSADILYGKNISGGVDCAFVLNCRGLTNCFGCVNLNNKSYYFLNQPMRPDEYKKKVKEIRGSYEKTENFKKEFEKFALEFPARENNNIKN